MRGCIRTYRTPWVDLLIIVLGLMLLFLSSYLPSIKRHS
jgi:hypothetical protein